MNWYKAKTILIVFLVIINAALLTYISADSYKSIKNEERVSETVISLLGDKGILIDKKLLDSAYKTESLKTVYASNIISDYQSFSELIFSGDVKKINDSEYTCEKGTVKYSGDSFYVKAAKNSVLAEVKKGSNPEKIAKKYLLTLGIDTSNTKPIISEDGEKKFLNYERKIGSYKCFGTGIKVEMNSLGIIAVSGTWHKYSKSDVKTELKAISSVLVDYMNLHTLTKSPVTITTLSLGYATLETEVYHEGILLIPVWEITDDKGNSKYIDARENL